MGKKKISFLLVLSFIFALLTFGSSNNTVSAATSGDYALKVGGQNSDNLNIDGGNYYVTGDPGQTVDLQLLVVNKSSDTRQFKFQVVTAYTNNKGTLAFDKTKVTDPSLKYPVRNYATPKDAVFKVPGNKTATLTFKVTVPKAKYNGMIMGGVTVSPYKEKAKGTVSSNGTLIKNRFSYSIPIQIQQKGAETEDAKYSIRTVRPALVLTTNGSHQGVNANVHNSTNSYTGSLKATAVVTKKGDKNFKIKQDYSSQNIAPTTNYNLGISWGKRSFQSGEYHLKVTYKTAGGLKSWVLNKDFSITNDQAAKYNKLAGQKPNYLWLYILLGILALAIILGLGIYLGRRNNNKDNNSNNTSRRRRR